MEETMEGNFNNLKMGKTVLSMKTNPKDKKD